MQAIGMNPRPALGWSLALPMSIVEPAGVPMGRTWPNLDADRVETPGYYWNERMLKLARLQAGEKLPRHVGRWEFIAHDRELTSSQVARIIFDRHPDLDVNDFTFTTTSPLDRRLPMGDRAPSGARALGVLAATFLSGLATGVWLSRRA